MYRKPVSHRQRPAPAFQQDGQRGRVKLLQGSSICHHLPWTGKQLGRQSADKARRHRMGQDSRKYQHVSDLRSGFLRTCVGLVALGQRSDQAVHPFG